jgi:hypothetical protein
MGLAALAFVHVRERRAWTCERCSSRWNRRRDNVRQSVRRLRTISGWAVFVFTVTRQGQPQLWLRPLDSMVPLSVGRYRKRQFPHLVSRQQVPCFFRRRKAEANRDCRRCGSHAGGMLLRIRCRQRETWNRDGVILFGSSVGLQRVSASGGGATLLTKPDPAKMETGHGYPQFSSGWPPFSLPCYEHGRERSRDLREFPGTSRSATAGCPNGGQSRLRSCTRSLPRLSAVVAGPDATGPAPQPGHTPLQDDPVSVAEEIGLNPNNSMRAAYWASDSGLLIYFLGAHAGQATDRMDR